MTCGELEQLLADYTFGELGNRQQGAVERHLGFCPRCAEEWRTYRQVVELAGQLPPLPMPPGVISQFLRNLKEGAGDQEQPLPPGAQKPGT